MAFLANGFSAERVIPILCAFFIQLIRVIAEPIELFIFLFLSGILVV